MKKIAVVILNWNGAKLLDQFLPSVIQYSPEATIYVADNASTDDSIAVIKTHFPSVQIIKNKANFGFAQGYNEALQEVDADIYALVNSDIEVTENWLKPILDTFESEPNTAIIQPKILDYKNKQLFEYAGAAGGFIDQYGYPFCRGRIFDSIESNQNQYNDSLSIFWASGACFFIRSKVYHELKGFDADFFAHQEEIDLCWRAKNKNYDIKYNGLSTVYHVGGATLNESNPKKTYLNFRNSLWMLTKNVPIKSLFQVLFVRLCLDGIAGIRFVIQGKWSHFTAILKAHGSFYQCFFKNYKKRTPHQSRNYFTIKSIVYHHYIEKKTIFSQLF